MGKNTFGQDPHVLPVAVVAEVVEAPVPEGVVEIVVPHTPVTAKTKVISKTEKVEKPVVKTDEEV